MVDIPHKISKFSSIHFTSTKSRYLIARRAIKFQEMSPIHDVDENYNTLCAYGTGIQLCAESIEIRTMK